MARKRMIDPRIWDSEQVMSLTARQFKLYIFLISQADDEGRLKLSIPLFVSRVFPLDPCEYEELMDDVKCLHECGLIRLYCKDKGTYIAHPNWKVYQTINKPSASIYPPPPDTEDDVTIESPGEKRTRSHTPNPVRREVAKRYGVENVGDAVEVKCAYCDKVGKVIMTNNSWVQFAGLTIDHKIPLSKGGPDTADNIVLSCKSCNSKKGAKSLNVDATSGLPDGSGGLPERSDGLPPNRIEENRREDNTSGDAGAETGSHRGKKPVTSELHQSIREAFRSQNSGDWDFAREGKHINELIKRSTRASPEDPGAYIHAVMEAFIELKRGGGRFWQEQPFLPSVLNSEGIWPRVLETMKTEEVDPEALATLEGVF